MSDPGVGDSLGARLYQEELARHARDQNAIIAADTGTGKTLISAMVIRWKMIMENMARIGPLTLENRKVALFLVPKVPLVDQQRAFLEENTPFKVRGYSGAMGVDYWDKTAWTKEFMGVDILVMTPQIFLNILRHAHWSIDRVSIIVFDEIHNCKGKSPEALIMMEHYHTIPNGLPRPKILGLTASPIFNPKKPVAALAEIEKLTDCKVYVVKAHTEDLAKHTFQAEDMIVDYPPTPSIFPRYPVVSLWVELTMTRLLPDFTLFPGKPKDTMSGNRGGPWFTTLENRYNTTRKALGPFGADLFVYVHVFTALETIKKDLLPIFTDRPDPDAEKRSHLDDLYEILAKHEHRLLTSHELLSEEWLSPKLLRLRELLLKQDSTSFRGIIFTYERQIATTLSLMFPRLGIPGVRAGPIVGHGLHACSVPEILGMKGMPFKTQDKVVADFRMGGLNLIIATSVAEEGLDFPLCSFVCRFDPPRTLPQYIQSRGRARMAGSTFVIMLEEGPSKERETVEALQVGEIRAKTMYGSNMDREDDEVELDENTPKDDGLEGRFIVEKTGASLTPAGSISLLNNLCSLIPRDDHTRSLQPVYETDPVTFRTTNRLPPALPIPREDLLFVSDPFCRTKKAAKRNAAFKAVLRLYELGVFDDFLLPIRREKGDTAEDIDGKPPVDVTGIVPMMDVLVHDPWGDMWRESSPIYVHQLALSDRKGRMGLVCGNRLMPFDGYMTALKQEVHVRLEKGVMLELEPEVRQQQLALMDSFMKIGIKAAITRRGLTNRSAVFLVPLDSSGQPDWDEIEHCVYTPSSTDWRAVDLSGKSDVFVSLLSQGGISKFVACRPDLNVTECIEADAHLAKYVASLAKFGRTISEDDTVLQCRPIFSITSTEFRDPARQKPGILSDTDVFIPQSVCQWLNLDEDRLRWFSSLPPLFHLLSSVYRARLLHSRLGVPELDLDRTIEALTIPQACASFNNQRLETLGDSFLKVATTIHVLNKFPHKHEGQLTSLRQNSVCNRYLLGRGHAQNLVSFMNIEPNSQSRWRITPVSTKYINSRSFVERVIPRRSVQDCMEALLGVAWLSGGDKAGLRVGTRLGLCFGGTVPWAERYPKVELAFSSSSPFPPLEENLGYTFKDKSLLVEALTHPSFVSGSASYQRLEFLGDAVLDLVTVEHFFHLYPNATSGKLTRARARCVCNSTLSALGTKKLEIHKAMFCDAISLVAAANKTARMFNSMDFTQVIDNIWRLDAPKALGDMVEALIGAVFVDSGWNYNIVKDVVIRLFKEVLDYIHPDMPLDPTSEFMIWVAKHGCTQARYRKASSSEKVEPWKDQVFVTIHGIDVGPPGSIQPKTSPVLARAEASVSARKLLEDPMSEFFFEKLCTCSAEEKKQGAEVYQAAVDVVTDEGDLNPETVEGFAISAQDQLLREYVAPTVTTEDQEERTEWVHAIL